jgi:DNA-binding response OmpR family regulator
MFSPCILLIHNDVKLLVELEAALKQAGYRVLTAYDGTQGIYLAQAALPEVIVCDVKLPAARGFAVKGALAQDSQTASIPVISLTKSLDKHELVAQVNAMIRNQSVHEEQRRRQYSIVDLQTQNSGMKGKRIKR